MNKKIKDLLLIKGYKKSYISNINLYFLVRIINNSESIIKITWVLNENTVLTGEDNRRIK